MIKRPQLDSLHVCTVFHDRSLILMDCIMITRYADLITWAELKGLVGLCVFPYPVIVNHILFIDVCWGYNR